MCNFSGKLIAWLDHELPEAEAIHVEEHVGKCAECREAVRSYREISEAFLDCYASALPRQRPQIRWHWAAVAGGIAAAILLGAVLARPRPVELPTMPRAAHAPAIAFEKTPAPVLAVHLKHTPRPMPPQPQWIATEPTVEIALPADAFFPPGAVPAGFSFIADVRPQY